MAEKPEAPEAQGADTESQQPKKPWVKPAIKSSATFDFAAVACPPEVQEISFPLCEGGVS